MDSDFLVKLTARRWALPILSQMRAGVPGRQAPLITATGASRASFLDSLAHLQALGLVQRNSGHGHPLRPEYELLEKGAHWAEMAEAVLARIEAESELRLVQRNWTLPVLLHAREGIYFGGLKNSLAPVSDRALSGVLKGLGEVNWLAREVEVEARPPRASYRAVAKGAEIAEILAAA